MNDSTEQLSEYSPAFQWFGGKARVASVVWDALGDVESYTEPFFGSGAMLFLRPPSHTGERREQVNDFDGFVANFWRAVKADPEGVASYCDWPCNEIDMTARHAWLVSQAVAHKERMLADPEYFDAKIAGWWCWGQCWWIGGGWCDGKGPWSVKDGVFGKHGTRPGVSSRRPHLGDDGQGVNRPQVRAIGTVADYGYHPMTMPELLRWFQFLSARLRHVRILNGDWRRAVTGGAAMTLPVRMQPDGAVGIFLDPPYADTADRTDGLYAHDSLSVAHDVREWAIGAAKNKKWRIVLAGFDGEHDELHERHGWRVIEWYRAGFLKGGMGNTAGTDEDGTVGHVQHKERLWLSPGCLVTAKERPEQQQQLFGGAA